jgi:hypothetical protein
MRGFEVIKQFLRQQKTVIHNIGLATAVSVQVAQVFKLPIPPITANSITFAVLACILRDISDHTCAFQQNKSYRHQEELYGDLIRKIQEAERVEEATLIQYSGRKANSLIFALLSKGANVTLYLKDENGAINQTQKERIISTIKDFSTDLASTSGTLKVYQYDSPASIRGVLIDNKVLAIGCYIYEYECKSQRNQGCSNEQVAVWGHDSAGMLLHQGSVEFELFKEQFSRQVSNYEEYIDDIQGKPCLHIQKGKINPIP